MKPLKRPVWVRKLLFGSSAALVIVITIVFTRSNRSSARQTLADQQQFAHDRPGDSDAQLKLGAALLAQHQLGEAGRACKTAANLAPADARPLNMLARIADAQHRQQDAIEYLQASLKIKQDNPVVWRAYGAELQEHNPGAAWRAFCRADDIDKSESVSWLRTGLREMVRKNKLRGLHDIQRAAALNPNDLVIEVELGLAARAGDEPTLAAQAFSKALSICPGNALALEGSAAATLQMAPSPADLSRAAEQLDQVLASAPTADAYRVRGQLKLIEKHYGEAVTDLNTALKMDPKLSLAHSMLYQCYTAMGQQRLALAEMASALSPTKPIASDSGRSR